MLFFFFFSSRRRHTRSDRDWSSDVCSSDLGTVDEMAAPPPVQTKVALTGALIKIGDPEGNTNTLAGDIIFAGTVDVLDYLYMPQRVAVPAGTTVSWKNGGDIVHTATSQDNSWDTGDIQPGQTTSITFNSAGTFTYACTPHPW